MNHLPVSEHQRPSAVFMYLHPQQTPAVKLPFLAISTSATKTGYCTHRILRPWDVKLRLSLSSTISINWLTFLHASPIVLATEHMVLISFFFLFLHHSLISLPCLLRAHRAIAPSHFHFFLSHPSTNLRAHLLELRFCRLGWFS